MPKRYTLILVIILLITVSYIITINADPDFVVIDNSNVGQPVQDSSQTEPVVTPAGTQADQSSGSGSPTALEPKFEPPLDDYKARVLYKPHGTYIDPATSPVQPEKFSGYHVGADFEILTGEEESVVEVRAICDGKLAIKRTAQGYGGLVAQYCVYQGQEVLILYGHLALSSVNINLGDEITSGQVIGRLGQPGVETDGERKHLHLGIRRGHDLVIAGYVQNESALSNYIDPMTTF